MSHLARIAQLGHHMGPWIAIVGLAVAYWIVYAVVRRIGDSWMQRRGKRGR